MTVRLLHLHVVAAVDSHYGDSYFCDGGGRVVIQKVIQPCKVFFIESM